MKQFFTSFLVVLLCYGVGMYSPAAAAQANSTYAKAKSYVNGRHKKSVKDMYTKFESAMPTYMYERAMKELKGSVGNQWFDRAKMGSNYVYIRIGKVKLFARLVQKGRKRAVILNGVVITPSDFRTPNLVQAKITRAYFKEALSRKGLFSFLLSIKKAFAGGKEVVDPQATVTPISVTDEDSMDLKCQEYFRQAADPSAKSMPKNDKEDLEAKIRNCPAVPPDLTVEEVQKVAGKKDNKNLGMFLGIGAAALILFLILKNRNDDNGKGKPSEPDEPDTPGEVPEGNDGVGRDENPIVCGGEGANCGGDEYVPNYGSGSSDDTYEPNTGSNPNVNVNSGGGVNTPVSGSPDRDLDTPPETGGVGRGSTKTGK